MPATIETAWGPALLDDGNVRFRLWAPDEKAVSLRTPAGDQGMITQGDGWFALTTGSVAFGDGYGFVLGDGSVVPDPAARAQVSDVHGLSRLTDPNAYEWETTWIGRPWEETVIYELHVGTFTPLGTFRSAIDRLDHLVDLGVTAVELMPLAQFGGRRGWGYDGVLLYAPHNTYGTPEDLKALVDAAHARGLMVFLDVVYNHFGPDGNYLDRYASRFFDPNHNTPWGAGIALSERAVRDYFVDNPVYWLNEFNLDGLRFDAIDHIHDAATPHLLEEMATRIRSTFERPIHLCTEDERNVVHLHPYEGGKPRLFTAEWNDDYHNVIHPILTGESEGYFKDFVDEPWRKLGRALSEGFVFQGEPSKMHGNAPRGVPSAGQPLSAMVICNQNHDQVGNRAFGDRLTLLTDHDRLALFTGVLLLGPQVPLLWMGEEWGETNPFCFFCDFDGDLAAAVRKGRRNEFSKFDAFIDPDAREDIPDPNLLQTFEASRIDWAKADTETGESWLALYRGLLAARAQHIVPRLPDVGPRAGKVLVAQDGQVDVEWTLGGDVLTMAINLTGDVLPDAHGRLVAAIANGALTGSLARPANSLVVTLSTGHR